MDVELNDLGAMLLEQNRIKKEIATQTTELKQLQASPVPQLDKAKFVPRVVHTIVELRFGLNRLGRQLISVVRSQEDQSAAHQAQVRI